jgi:hypothetical protein
MSSPAPSDRTADPRAADLRRMRVIATLLLVAMTVVFVATSFAQVQLRGTIPVWGIGSPNGRRNSATTANTFASTAHWSAASSAC